MVRGRKPNLVACTNCRQAKRACDKHLTFPGPCTRCRDTGRVCSVDPDFRRERRKERLTRVEQELQEARQGLGATSISNETSLSNEDASHSPAPATTIPRRSTTRPRQTARRPLLQPDAPPQRAIRGVDLAAQRIKDLLDEFFTNYHPFCPILPDQSRFLDYSNPCPLLFWTVLVTALRGKPEHQALYSTIAETVAAMAYDTVQPAAASFQAMQALLLLCQWPLPFGKSQDPSHSFVALATNIGLRMGLHRPRHAGDFAADASNDPETEILRRKTWAVCFITNLSVNGGLGLPATVQLDQGLLELLATRPAWLPDLLCHQLHISRHTFNICSSLGCCESSSTGLLPAAAPVVRMFETELRALECRYYASWSPVEYIIFLGCRMILYTFAIASHDNDGDNNNDGTADPYLRSSNNNSSSSSGGSFVAIESLSHWLVQGYVAATATIQTASRVPEQLFHAPSRVQKMVANAVCFLLLLKCSRHHGLVEDSVLSGNLTHGWHILRRLSVAPGDFMARASMLFERFITRTAYIDTTTTRDGGQGQVQRTMAFLPIRSRMGANVALSAVLRIRYCLANHNNNNSNSNNLNSSTLATSTSNSQGPGHGTAATTDGPTAAVALDGAQVPPPDSDDLLNNALAGNGPSLDDFNWDELFSEMAGYSSF
ncbi:hypothetical protein ABEF95_010702 [Exophiala dermatitidis]